MACPPTRRPTATWCLLALVLAGCAGTGIAYGNRSQQYAAGVERIPAPPSTPLLRLDIGMHPYSITGVAADRSGEMLATCSVDRTARVWRADGQGIVCTQVLRPPVGPGAEGELLAVAVAPDASWVAVAGETGRAWDGTACVYLFDPVSGDLRRRLTGLPGAVTALRVRADGQALAIGLQQGGLAVVEPASGTRLWSAPQLPTCSGLCWLPDGGLAVACLDGSVHRFAAGGQEDRSETFLGRPAGLACSPDGVLAIGLADRAAVLLVDALTLRGRGSLPVPTAGSGFDHAKGSFSLGNVAWADGFWACGYFLPAPLISDPDSDQQNQLLHWPDPAAPPRVIASGAPTRLGTMCALADGSVAVATGLPCLAIRGARTLTRGPTGPDMRGKIGDALMASPDGTRVAFGLASGGDRRVVFDLARGLVEGPAAAAGLAPASLAAAGIHAPERWHHRRRPTYGSRDLGIDPEETSRSWAAQPDGLGFLIGSDWHLTAFDPGAGVRWKVATPGTRGIVATRSGQLVIAAHRDGTIRWRRWQDGGEVLALFVDADGRRWVAWTPDGSYVCSAGGEQLVGWHLNRSAGEAAEFLPCGRLADRFHRPDAVRQALTGGPTQQAVPGIAAVVRGVPRVRILSPADASAVPAGTALATVAAAVEDCGGGLDEVRVLVNGKSLDGSSRGLRAAGTAAAHQLSWEVPLLPGVNEVQITAFSRERAESPAAVVRITCPERQAATTLHGIAIAVGAYDNPKYQLAWTVADAEAVQEVLARCGKRLFGAVRWTSLRDAEVSRTSVQAAFAAVQAAAKPGDTLVVFYAGHGVMSEGSATAPGRFYLIPPGIRQLYGHDDDLAANAVSADDLRDWCRAVPAQKQVLILDACESGGAVEGLALRGAAEERALAQLSRATGTAILAAAGSAQGASEIAALGHGVFTYALLEGLAGKARSVDRPVTVRSLDAWLSQIVPELTGRYRAQLQVPTSSHRGQDFPLTLP